MSHDCCVVSRKYISYVIKSFYSEVQIPTNVEQKIVYFFVPANSQPNSDDEEEEDNDYSPEEDEFKKVSLFWCTNITKTGHLQ